MTVLATEFLITVYESKVQDSSSQHFQRLIRRHEFESLTIEWIQIFSDHSLDRMNCPLNLRDLVDLRLSDVAATLEARALFASLSPLRTTPAKESFRFADAMAGRRLEL